MNSNEASTLKLIISEFELLNPNIRIDLQQVPFSDAQNKYKIAAGAGDAPDVFRSEIAWIADFAELGFLVPLENSINKKELDDFLDAALTYGRYKGHLWALPQVTDCLALLYNKEVFSKANVKAPTTLDELVAVGRKLSTPSTGRYALGINPEAYWAQTFIWSFGGDLINAEQRTVEVNSPKSIEGLKFFKDLYGKYKIVSPEIDFVNGYNNMMTAFKSGKSAMIINGPWSTSDILTGAAFEDPKNLGVTVIPPGPGGNGSPVGGHSYVVYAGSKKKTESIKFIQFLSQKKNQVIFANKHNLLPTRKSAYDDPSIVRNPLLQGFKDQVEVARNRPVIPEGSRIYTSFNLGVQMILSGRETPEKAMKKVAKKWKRMLR